MNVRTATVRKAHRVLQALAEGKLEGWMVHDAREVAPALAERPRQVRHIGDQPTRAEAKAAKVVRRSAAMSDLHQRAERRANGSGELCGQPFSPQDPGQLCHLDGGNGKRQKDQWIGNVLMEHGRCHQGPGGLDVAPLSWLDRVKAWAGRCGYPLPKRFRKLEIKAEFEQRLTEARASQGAT